MTLTAERVSPGDPRVHVNYGDGGRAMFVLSDNGEVLKRIPVYNVRNKEDHEPIAKAVASGDPGAFDVGIIGILIAVEDPRGKVLLERERKKMEVEQKQEGRVVGNDEKFWRIKQGRPAEAKVPFMATPRIIPKFVDFDKLHPDFRHLADREARERLYKYPLHVIWPVNGNPAIHRGAFVTSVEDSHKKAPDQWVEHDTVCIFVPGEDPDWRHIGERAGVYNPHALFGVTSFNLHGEQPPFNDEELAMYVQNKGKAELEFDFFVHDSVAKASKLKSSHTQVRLPLAGEKPELVVVRKGPVGPGDIANWTGYKVRVLDSVAAAKPASRAAPPEANLFPNLVDWMENAKKLHKKSANSHLRLIWK